MSESIEQQLIELSQFKTLISQILAETGNTAPDTGFRQWYEAIKTAILSSARGLVILANTEAIHVPIYIGFLLSYSSLYAICWVTYLLSPSP